MKLFDKKRIVFILIAMLLGLVFSAFLLYEQFGKFGKTEIFILLITALIAATILLIIIKIGNK